MTIRSRYPDYLKILRSLILPACCFAATSPAIASDKLEFVAPDGWVILGLGNIGNTALSGEYQRAKASGASIFLAVDPADPDGITAMQANVIQKRIAITEDMLKPLADGMHEQILTGLAAKTGISIKDFSFEVKSTQLEKFGEVTVGKVVAEIVEANDQDNIALISYFLPGESSFAILMFTTKFSNISKYEPIFDAAARNTKGLCNVDAEATGWDWVKIKKAVMAAVVLAAIAMLLLVFVFSVRFKTLFGWTLRILAILAFILAVLLGLYAFNHHQPPHAAVGGPIFLGYWFWRWSKRLFQPTAEELLGKDQRPPILYLRPFKQDESRINAPKPWLERLAPSYRPEKTLEESLVGFFGELGPVVAIGKPGEKVQPLGASRTYATNSEWQEKVRAMASKAALIVLVLGDTPGIDWELAEIPKQCGLSRLLILIPPGIHTEPGWVQAWKSLRKRYQFLPEVGERTFAVRFDTKDTPVLIEGATAYFPDLMKALRAQLSPESPGHALTGVGPGVNAAETPALENQKGPRYCPKCGNKDQEDDARFCGRCGTLLKTCDASARRKQGN